MLRDYAHTPDALERALATLRPLTPGRLIVVFGCGGDRDRGKRPIMGQLAAELADLPVVTSDNPRTEDPDAIIDDVERGMGAAPRICASPTGAWRSPRRWARPRPGDTLLLAGKGHETYQVIGTEKQPFDEREIVLAALGAAHESLDRCASAARARACRRARPSAPCTARLHRHPDHRAGRAVRGAGGGAVRRPRLPGRGARPRARTAAVVRRGHGAGAGPRAASRWTTRFAALRRPRARAPPAR